MAEQGLADKAGSSPRGICEGLAQNPQPFGSTRRSPDLDFAAVTSVNKAGGRRMNGRHGTIIVVAVLSFELGGVAHLRAAEGAAALDCGKDRSPLAVTVCSDEAAIAAERRTTASYLAAYYALPEARRPGFRSDHTQWLAGLTSRCHRPSDLRPGDQPTLSAECVRRSYTQRGEVYHKKLSGLALDEITLSPVLLKRIQTRLIDLQFLSGNADGVFGANTRVAIRNYQASIDHVQSDFLSAEERSKLLDPPAIQTHALEPNEQLLARPYLLQKLQSRNRRIVQVKVQTTDRFDKMRPSMQSNKRLS